MTSGNLLHCFIIHEGSIANGRELCFVPNLFTMVNATNMVLLYVFSRNHIIDAVTSPINHGSQCFRKLVVVGLR